MCVFFGNSESLTGVLSLIFFNIRSRQLGPGVFPFSRPLFHTTRERIALIGIGASAARPHLFGKYGVTGSFLILLGQSKDAEDIKPNWQTAATSVLTCFDRSFLWGDA